VAETTTTTESVATTAAVAASTAPPRTSVIGRIRQDWIASLACVIVLIYLVIAIGAPWLSPQSPYVQHLQQILQGPSGAHLLGTDGFGRDELSRLFVGIRSSVAIGAIVAGVSTSIGLLLALVAGYLGGIVDFLISRIVDVGLAFPTLVLSLALITAMGVGARGTAIALVLGFIPFTARVLRSAVLKVRQEGFIESAQVTGVHPLRVVIRHVLPNLVGSITVQTTLVFAYAILGEAGLSYVGLGVQAPTPSLGNMIADGQTQILQVPRLTIVPGIAVAVLIMCLLVIGDALRDAADPLTVR
jgi:peptide/nickel transport system permease protein